GVAYLDDGTMVVVDGARRMINKTIDIAVTSVHQTTAGKMIFGRYDERAEQLARQPAASSAEANGPRPAEPPHGGEPAPRHPPPVAERPPRPLLPDAPRE